MTRSTRNIISGAFVAVCTFVPSGTLLQSVIGVGLIAWLFVLGSTAPKSST